MPKSVLVIGGGPAGLVAAKTLSHHPSQLFEVSLFDAADRLGGMWRHDDPDESGEKCNPRMPTNLSRFTVAFSDLDWHDVDLSSPDEKEKDGIDTDGTSAEGADAKSSTSKTSKSEPPMFPAAHQVARYLQTYASRSLASMADRISTNRIVTHASLHLHPNHWSIHSIDKTTQTQHIDTFDYLIIASGFFTRPATPIPSQSSVPRTHSSQFRHVSSLLEAGGKKGKREKKSDIVVVGGGISGSEAAATAAMQISNARYAPGSKPEWAASRIYHVFDRPFYCLPRHLPTNPHNAAIQDFRLAPDFAPLDWVLYNLSRRGGAGGRAERGTGQISPSYGAVPPEKAEKGHMFLRSVLGGDQRELGVGALVYKPEMLEFPAYTGISDSYAEFVRSGVIVPVRGRAGALVDTLSSSSSFIDADDAAVDRSESQSDVKTSLHLTHTSAWTTKFPTANPTSTIDNVAAVIEATGYTPDLSYLSDDVQQLLGHDASSSRVPFLLAQDCIFAPSLPTIAFVGFYEGPYWGIMELQARLIAQHWTIMNLEAGVDAAVSNAVLQAHKEMSTDIASSVRESLKQKDSGECLRVPQFWMPDYAGMMEGLARAGGKVRCDELLGEGMGMVFPGRYVDLDAPHILSVVSASASRSAGHASVVPHAAPPPSATSLSSSSSSEATSSTPTRATVAPFTTPPATARFAAAAQESLSVATRMQTDFASLLASSSTGTHFLAPAIFRALQGAWSIRRKITSRHPSAASGSFRGTAHFHPRDPTAIGVHAEYLYIEYGTFRLDTGFEAQATRRYVYRLYEGRGVRVEEDRGEDEKGMGMGGQEAIKSFFVEEDGESAAGLFMALKFERPLRKRVATTDAIGTPSIFYRSADPDPHPDTLASATASLAFDAERREDHDAAFLGSFPPLHPSAHKDNREGDMEVDIEKGWLARSRHFCDPDTYVGECEFRFRGAGLGMFGITYRVEGPGKDYTHESWYERPVAGRKAI